MHTLSIVVSNAIVYLYKWVWNVSTCYVCCYLLNLKLNGHRQIYDIIDTKSSIKLPVTCDAPPTQLRCVFPPPSSGFCLPLSISFIFDWYFVPVKEKQINVEKIILEFEKSKERRGNLDGRYNGAHWPKVSIWQGTKSDGGVGWATADRGVLLKSCAILSSGRPSRKIVMGTKNKTLSVCATTIRLPPRPLAKTAVCKSYTCAAREA